MQPLDKGCSISSVCQAPARKMRRKRERTVRICIPLDSEREHRLDRGWQGGEHVADSSLDPTNTGGGRVGGLNENAGTIRRRPAALRTHLRLTLSPLDGPNAILGSACFA